MTSGTTTEKTVDRAARRAARRRITRRQTTADERMPLTSRTQITKQRGGVVYRINSLTKWSMLLVAFFLDIAPILALMLVIFFVASSLGLGMDTVRACADSAEKGFWFGDIGNHIRCVAGGGLGIASGLATLWFLGPMILLLTSFICSLIAPLVFFLWFGVKKVPYFSTKGGRLELMLVTFIVESMPFISILPGITFSTWRQIGISRKEDREQATN
jgi:hypothetical protein